MLITPLREVKTTGIEVAVSLKQQFVDFGAVLGKFGGNRFVKVVGLLETGEEDSSRPVVRVVARFENFAGYGFRLGVLALADQVLGIADGGGGVTGKSPSPQGLLGGAVGREVDRFLVGKVGRLEITRLEGRIAATHGIFGFDRILLTPDDFPVGFVLDRVEGILTAGSCLDRKWHEKR